MSRMRSIVKIAALGFLVQTVFGSEALAEGRPERGPGLMVTICHKPGTPAEKTIMVNLNALQGHLGHGDLEGPCVLIDAHSQYDLDIRRKVIPLIDKGGISRIILSPRRREQNQGIAPPEDVVDLAAEDPAQRIVPALRIKFGPYNDSNKFDQFKLYLEEQLGQLESPLDHPYEAMAEVLMYHAKKGDGAGELIVHPDDPRVALALKYAVPEGWPFVVHIEFAALFQKDPSLHDEFTQKLERLLDENPEHPFAMIHMGQLEPDRVRSLIESHDNVYFMTSQSNPVAIGEKPREPWVNMFDGERLSQEWEQLVLDYSDRFILNFDNVFNNHWGQFYLDQIALWRKALKWLPIDVAEAVAHGNAERLWSLTPVE